VCIINMTTAFLTGHGGRLTGSAQTVNCRSCYLGAFVVLLLAGPGRFSVDGRG
jgi:uncharacterized membrane protein YphA (DoxX/SURF4 family)